MKEQIRSAQVGICGVVNAVQIAHKMSNAIQRPEGRTIADNATTAYLADLLRLARELEDKLANL